MTAPHAQPDQATGGHPAEDYQPHIAFYHRSTALSFVWNGGDKVAVCPGGYAEPVDHWIAAPPGLELMPAREAMRQLQAVAVAHATT